MRRVSLLFLPLLALTVACSQPSAPSAGTTAAAAPAATTPKLGIRAVGETEIQPDMSQVPPDVQKVFAHIDENVDQHVANLQEWIQQPSISNSGEGIPESAEMVKGFFDELGCQQTQVYDVGITEYGTPGNPVVYAKCDEGAEKTLLIYWMYDTMPVTQPDAWNHPPFEGQIVAHEKFPKVLLRPRRHQLEGPADGAAERLPGHQGGARQAAGEPHLRRRGRRGADGHRPAQVGQGSPRAARGRRRDDPLRQPVDQRQRRLRRRVGRLRLRRADHLGHGVGPRADGVGHPRQQQARHRQPGLAPHQDAGVARHRRRQHARSSTASSTASSRCRPNRSSRCGPAPRTWT